MFLIIILPFCLLSTTIALPILNIETKSDSVSSGGSGSVVAKRDGFYGIYSGYTGYSGGEASTSGTDPGSEYISYQDYIDEDSSYPSKRGLKEDVVAVDERGQPENDESVQERNDVPQFGMYSNYRGYQDY